MRMRVRVPVTTLWVAPDRPRAVDAPAVADRPDVAGWLTALDAHAADDEAGDESGDGRLGLHGRIHTQVLAGEPVTVVGGSPRIPRLGGGGLPLAAELAGPARLPRLAA